MNFIPLLLTVVSYFITYNSAYKDNIPTCDDYAKNTYLYTLTGVLLTWTYWSHMIKLDKLVKLNQNFMPRIISFIAFIGIYIYTKSIDPNNVVKKNLLWIILIGLLAFITLAMYILVKQFMLNGVIGATVIGFITYYGLKQYPNLVNEKTQKKVTLGLVTLIVMGILGTIFIKDPHTLYMLLLVMTVASIMLMTLRLLVHHRRIEKNKEKCLKGEIKPDYIDESIGVITTIINLILDIARLSLMTRKR